MNGDTPQENEVPEQEVIDDDQMEQLIKPPFTSEQITSWRRRNPRTMALIMLAVGVPVVMGIILAAPYAFPALALTSVELFGAACVSSTAVVGLAIREGVFRGSVEERQQWPGLIGKAVNWMRENPKYTKAIAIPIVAAAVTAGVLSGGLLLGAGVTMAYVGALGVGMFAASATALYILPRSNAEHTNKAATDATEKPSLFENVKQFIYEHKVLATVGITLAVGAAVLSGGIALGIGVGVAMISASVVCGTTISGLYAAQVMAKGSDVIHKELIKNVEQPVKELQKEEAVEKSPPMMRRYSAPEIMTSHVEAIKNRNNHNNQRTP